MTRPGSICPHHYFMSLPGPEQQGQNWGQKMVTTPCRAFHPAACEILPCISSFTAACKLFVLKAKKKKKKGVDGFCLLLGCHTQNEERSNAATSPRGEEPGGAGTGSAVSQGPEMFPAQCPWCARGAAGAGGLLQHCGDKTILLKKELHSGQGWLCLHLCWSCGYMGNISKL